jgi:DNA helicase-2/ATP-dependent DNA helicase PcrA
VPELEGGAGKAVNVNQFGVGNASRKLPDVSALLDPEQYAILNREDEGALLILGGAGSGKTTVALHRMAQLAYKRPRFYTQSQMKVVVPEQGLVRLTERLLRGLNLDDVSVETFDAWITAQGRQILKGVPKRLYEWTPSEVVVMKRHPAMFAVVDRFVDDMRKAFAERVRFLLGSWRPELVEIFAADGPEPLWDRVERFEREALAAVGTSTDWYRDKVHELVRELRKTPLEVEVARSELFANPDLLALLVAGGEGVITPKMTESLARHTRKQFEDPDGGAIDQDDLRAARSVDGAEVEEDEYAGTMDVEDYAILLYLMFRIHGRVARKSKSITHYKHLVIDEAQDLAPIELRLLGKSLADDATVTVAGDAAQQSDPTVVFRSWDDVLAQLEMPSVEEARLATNYRCPRPVAAFGHKVLGALAQGGLPPSVKDGRPVIFTTYPNEGLAVVNLTEALTELFDKERLASVAIICENEENAKAVYDGLRNVDDVRLVLDGEFSFKPGIDVTDVAQVKGLEFDYVIIPDANANVYPDTPVARRTMHIAVTRAVHQLWVMSVGRPSEIVL